MQIAVTNMAVVHALEPGTLVHSATLTPAFEAQLKAWCGANGVAMTMCAQWQFEPALGARKLQELLQVASLAPETRRTCRWHMRRRPGNRFSNAMFCRFLPHGCRLELPKRPLRGHRTPAEQPRTQRTGLKLIRPWANQGF